MGTYIKFEQDPEDPKFTMVLNKKSGDRLGTIAYHPKWRVYVFGQYDPDVVFSSGCLRDIAQKCDELTAPTGKEE